MVLTSKWSLIKSGLMYRFDKILVLSYFFIKIFCIPLGGTALNLNNDAMI